jgi:DNA-binding XRE family transcriptional regulator
MHHKEYMSKINENKSVERDVTHVTPRARDNAQVVQKAQKLQTDGFRIRELREILRMTQEDFADQCGVRRNAVLLWESGKFNPSAKVWRRMAKLAGKVAPRTAFWFWEMAGIDREAFEDLVPEFEKMARDAENRVLEKMEASTGDSALVPIMRTPVFSDQTVAVPPEDIEDYLSFPRQLIQTAGQVYALRVTKEFVRPIFSEGDLLVIDPSGQRFVNFENELVAIRYVPDSEARNLADRSSHGQPLRDYMYGKWPYLPEGIYVGWLHTDPPVRGTTTRQMNLNSAKIVSEQPMQPGLEFTVPVAWVTELGSGKKHSLTQSGTTLIGRVVCWIAGNRSFISDTATE